MCHAGLPTAGEKGCNPPHPAYVSKHIHNSFIATPSDYYMIFYLAMQV